MVNVVNGDIVAVLGASRGLGRQLAREIAHQAEVEKLVLVARGEEQLNNLSTEFELHDIQVGQLAFDLANLDRFRSFTDFLSREKVNRLIYVAGGGPFGEFSSKEWKDHLWAFNLNLLMPTRLLHWAMNEGSASQFIYVGSAICESEADPMASSYSSAKHAMLGLYRGISYEKSNFDFRIYSPGYMDTDMLPKNARPRQNGDMILSPEVVARDLWSWAKSDSIKAHRLFND